MKVFVALLIGIASALVVTPTVAADTYAFLGWEDTDGNAHCWAVGDSMIVDPDSDVCPQAAPGPYTDADLASFEGSKVIFKELSTGARVLGNEYCVSVSTTGYVYFGPDCSLGRLCSIPAIDPFHPTMPTCRIK